MIEPWESNFVSGNIEILGKQNSSQYVLNIFGGCGPAHDSALNSSGINKLNLHREIIRIKFGLLDNSITKFVFMSIFGK